MLGSSGTEKGGFGKGQWRKHLGNQKEVLDFQDRLEGEGLPGDCRKEENKCRPEGLVCLSVCLSFWVVQTPIWPHSHLPPSSCRPADHDRWAGGLWQVIAPPSHPGGDAEDLRSRLLEQVLNACSGLS